MGMDWQERLGAGGSLREIVREATAALVQMDAARLEELAHCCADLNPAWQQSMQDGEGSDSFASGAEELEVLRWLLAETEGNLKVLYRSRALRLRRYAMRSDVEAGASGSWNRGWEGESYGDN